MGRVISKKKKLQKEAESLWKEYIRLRDGEICNIQENYPLIPVNHTKVYQADHLFTRSIRELFLDVVNGNMICSKCNFHKGSARIPGKVRFFAKPSLQESITIALHEITKKRYGDDQYNRIFEIAQTHSPFQDWGKIGWLEEQIEILGGMVEELRNAP